uniref:Phosphomannomutase n=1 Tax=Strigamia maritima TaxID=126957 RepID=T1IKQ5_STRMM
MEYIAKMRLINRLLFRRGCRFKILSRGMSLVSQKDVICLFDVDGTITPPRQKISNSMDEFLQKLKQHCTVGLVGGSDISKIADQIGGINALSKYEYVFSENGLVAYKNGLLFHTQSIASYFDEETLQKFMNVALRKLSEITLPFKRGTFIEYRKGMLNISPVGRNCTQAERDAFEKLDEGGNDHEIFKDARTVGHSVTSPEDTMEQVKKLFSV